ncbi:MAG: phosphatase PAP2 family protein [Terriglobia bacterium]|jgi:membrane-associated phospholipid phosphatase
MLNSRRLTLRVRLEDAIAFLFFVFFIVVLALFQGMRHSILSPADVLIIIPAVCLLLTKEIVHYFVAGKELHLESAEDVRAFINPYWQIVRDFAPFLVLLFMYYTMWGNATGLLSSRDRDLQLIAWDQRLFGFQASVALQRIISPPLTAWMEFAYFFHLPNIPIVACFIYIWRPRQRFREMMTGLVVITAIGVASYMLVPGVGPMYSLRDQYTVPLTQQVVGLLNQESAFIDFARVKRDVFPSMHVGISFVVWLYAWRNSRVLFWILAPFILSLWFSTVYLRYHYLVDVVAGLILAPLCYWLANWMFKRYAEIEIPVWLPASWADRMRLPRPDLSGPRAQATPDAQPASEQVDGVQDEP